MLLSLRKNGLTSLFKEVRVFQGPPPPRKPPPTPRLSSSSMESRNSRNRKQCRQTGSRQSTPLSTIRTRYGNTVSTPGNHTDWQKQAEFSPKGKPIRNFSIDPISSIRTPIADAIFADAISETSRNFGTRLASNLVNSVHTRCIVKTSGFTRRVCKNRGFYIKFKGFLVEFLENRRS